jgi:hypothetical protein
VIAGVVVMRHEGRDLAFEIAGQVIMLEQDAVLELDSLRCGSRQMINTSRRLA